MMKEQEDLHGLRPRKQEVEVIGMHEARPSMGRGFLHNWLRWWTWLVCLGIGYHSGELVMLTTRHAAETGLFIFVSGVIGYMLLGVPVASIIALVVVLVPSLGIFPTTLMVGIVRVFVIGLLLGIATLYLEPTLFEPVGVQTGPVQSGSVASDNRTVCLTVYRSQRFKDGSAACKKFMLANVANLTTIMHGDNMHAVLSNSLDMARAGYVTAFSYNDNGEPENARQAALHSVGWGIFALGAMAALDPKGTNGQYSLMKAELAKDMRSLNTTFPGVVEEERKAVQESASH